jgi:quercetin dioxygenase-like cupin family protein
MSDSANTEPGVRRGDLNSGLVANPLATTKTVFLGREGDSSRPVILYLRMDAGQTAPEHSHPGWACTIVLEGSVEIGGMKLGVGEFLVAEPGATYGPVVPGSDGFAGLEIFASEDGAAPRWDENDPRVVAFRASGVNPWR